MIDISQYKACFACFAEQRPFHHSFVLIRNKCVISIIRAWPKLWSIYALNIPLETALPKYLFAPYPTQ